MIVTIWGWQVSLDGSVMHMCMSRLNDSRKKTFKSYVQTYWARWSQHLRKHLLLHLLLSSLNSLRAIAPEILDIWSRGVNPPSSVGIASLTWGSTTEIFQVAYVGSVVSIRHSILETNTHVDHIHNPLYTRVRISASPQKNNRPFGRLFFYW